MLGASFSSAVGAAREAASGQHYPVGALYMVATPIGNLADISLRALHVLELADTIACEDTRHTQLLLRAYGIEKPSAAWMPVHQHNEAEAAQQVVQRLRNGQRVAYASDAGTPGISDPGARLVAAVVTAGLRAIPLPGASSVTALLSVGGLVLATGAQAGFVFYGFLPSKALERSRAVDMLAGEIRPVLLLEAPHRLEATAKNLAVLGSRSITVGRELTKQYEEIATVNAQALPAWLAADPNRLRGEFALLLHGGVAAQQALEGDRLLNLLLLELPLKTAVRLTADITGLPRNGLYARALELKQPASEASSPSSNLPRPF